MGLVRVGSGLAAGQGFGVSTAQCSRAHKGGCVECLDCMGIAADNTDITSTVGANSLRAYGVDADMAFKQVKGTVHLGIGCCVLGGLAQWQQAPHSEVRHGGRWGGLESWWGCLLVSASRTDCRVWMSNAAGAVLTRAVLCVCVCRWCCASCAASCCPYARRARLQLHHHS